MGNALSLRICDAKGPLHHDRILFGRCWYRGGSKYCCVHSPIPMCLQALAIVAQCIHIDLSLFDLKQSVQCGLEVVQDDSVGEALEHERQLPEWVKSAHVDGRGNGQHIEDDADHGP